MSFELTTQQMRQQAQITLSSLAKHNRGEWPLICGVPQLVDCDGPSGSLTLAYHTLPQMSNALGIVHGGVTATMLDNCMGITSCVMAGHITPTVTITVNYAKPVPLDATIHVRTRTVSKGRTTVHLLAEIFLSSHPDEALVSATGVYYAAPTQSKP